MTPERKWKIMHAFRRKVALGILSPICCDADRLEMLPQVGAGDDPSPVLVCFACGIKKSLGTYDYEAMERLIESSTSTGGPR